jgi:hypothetical protein
MADQTTSEIVNYFRVCDGTRVRYADTRKDSDTVILMLAPWPRPCGRTGESGIRSVLLAEWWRSICPDSVIPTSPSD